MYGRDIGSLTVLMKTIDNNNNLTAKWTLKGEKGNKWFQAQVPIDSKDKDFFIYIEGDEDILV